MRIVNECEVAIELCLLIKEKWYDINLRAVSVGSWQNLRRGVFCRGFRGEADLQSSLVQLDTRTSTIAYKILSG